MGYFTQREKKEGTATGRGIRIRPGNAEDEFAAFEVMSRAMGYAMHWQQHAPARHHLRTSPCASFRVAEETGRFGSPKIVGYARSIVRERVWMLTEFFVLPDFHRRGIGGALLAGCLEEGAQFGAESRLVLASHHAAADSLYIRKADCFPRLPMLLLTGALDGLRVLESPEPLPLLERSEAQAHPRAVPPGALIAEPFVLTPSVEAELETLDRQALGYARSPEHRFWAQQMGGPEGASRLFRRAKANASPQNEPLAGYACIGAASSGPALASDPADLPRMIAHAAALLGKRQRAPGGFERGAPPDHYLAVPGSNAIALRWLLDCGWRIVYQYLYMSSHPPGSLEGYLCHNPLYIP